jgi:hypothetical protein
MDPAQPARPSGRHVTLTLELANTRKDRNDRLRNRTESYILGVTHGPDANGFQPAFDPFSFSCYRALLLGAPGAVIGATLQSGKRNLLTEPLSPQRLAGEEFVERREWSNRIALFFTTDTDAALS